MSSIFISLRGCSSPQPFSASFLFIIPENTRKNNLRPEFIRNSSESAISRLDSHFPLRILSSRIAKYFAFQIVQPGDRPIVIIVTIQIFTVLFQVALASILGLYHFHGFNSQILPNYIMTYCKNFIVALPVQLFLAGPIARTLFRLLFRRTEEEPRKSIKQAFSNAL